MMLGVRSYVVRLSQAATKPAEEGFPNFGRFRGFGHSTLQFRPWEVDPKSETLEAVEFCLGLAFATGGSWYYLQVPSSTSPSQLQAVVVEVVAVVVGIVAEAAVIE